MAGIPERTYRRLAKLRAGDETIKGPWPSPAVDAVEALAAKYASDWPAWGHREIAATMRADGHDVSTSTVERALRQRGLLLPRGFRADRKSWAVLRRKVFHDPPTERNRVWQTDFSEFETPSGGICRICAVIDYATKYCLAAKVTPTVLGLDDLRADRGTLELVDEHTGGVINVVPAPIAVVSDNGPCFRGEIYQAAFTGDDPLLRHVRTPRPIAADQRRHRTLLRHPQVRAPLPSAHRRRRRSRDGSRPLPPHLQHHPPASSARRPDSSSGLPLVTGRQPGPLVGARLPAGHRTGHTGRPDPDAPPPPWIDCR